MPATPTIMAVSQLAGAGISALGQFTQGKEAEKAQTYNASVLEQSASVERAIAEREVDIIKKNAILNEYRSRKILAITTGEQIAGYAGRGVSASTGSPLDVMADSIANAELEIAIGNWNAENEIATTTYNAEVGARNKESEARFRRLYGKSYASNAGLKSIGTLLSAGTMAYTQLSKEKPRTTATVKKIGGGAEIVGIAPPDYWKRNTL